MFLVHSVKIGPYIPQAGPHSGYIFKRLPGTWHHLAKYELIPTSIHFGESRGGVQKRGMDLTLGS